MDQTPAHENHNPDLLELIPRNAKTIVEVGCSSGALAREYKKINSDCRYVGVECVPEYVKLAERYCDSVIELDIERANEDIFRDTLACDCWIFGDVLEHLRDPWTLLSRIRKFIPDSGSVVACIPNAQHWSVQARLSCGDFRYENSGLLDRTHLRFFTKHTIMEMFHNAGFKIANAGAKIYNEPDREKVLPVIKSMAACIGADPDMAARDALPFQYVIRAVPA